MKQNLILEYSFASILFKLAKRSPPETSSSSIPEIDEKNYAQYCEREAM